jgi:hypothetical protein
MGTAMLKASLSRLLRELREWTIVADRLECAPDVAQRLTELSDEPGKPSEDDRELLVGDADRLLGIEIITIPEMEPGCWLLMGAGKVIVQAFDGQFSPRKK